MDEMVKPRLKHFDQHFAQSKSGYLAGNKVNSDPLVPRSKVNFDPAPLFLGHLGRLQRFHFRRIAPSHLPRSIGPISEREEVPRQDGRSASGEIVDSSSSERYLGRRNFGTIR